MTSAEEVFNYIEPVMRKYEGSDTVHRAIIETALENIDNGTAKVIGVSGKKAAGKDTFYDEYVIEVDASAVKNPISAGIRKEATEIILFLYAALKEEPESPEVYWDKVASKFENRFSIGHTNAKAIIDLLLNVLKSRPDVTGMDRDNEITKVLQILGNDAHAAQDEKYWARTMALSALTNAALGKTSIVPDIRFLRDAEAIHLLGGKIVRLEISPEVQRERLMSRDGLVVPKETLGHISEIALDNYKKFDTIINSNNMSPKEVIHVVKASW